MTRSDLAPLLIALHDLQDKITLDKRHCYRMGGKVIPGCTSVIKTMDAPALDAWKVRVQVEGTARVAFNERPWENEEEPEYVDRLAAMAKLEFEHERLANEAADVGKQVHALIEHSIRGQLGQETEPPEATDEALFTFAGWRDWTEEVGLVPLMAEGRVCWPINQIPPAYAGTFDILATFDRGAHKDRIVIIDAKPNARIYPERRMQLAAYAKPIRDLIGADIGGMVVALPRDGGDIEMVPVAITNEDFEAFRSCLSLYNWLRQLQREERAAAREAVA